MFHVQINVMNVQVHYHLIVQVIILNILECKNNYYYDTDGCYKLNNFVLVESNFFD